MNLDNLFRRFLGLHRVDTLSLAPIRIKLREFASIGEVPRRKALNVSPIWAGTKSLSRSTRKVRFPTAPAPTETSVHLVGIKGMNNERSTE